MKRIKLCFGIVASLLLLVNASVWEGTAGVSQALPETGLYAATNSFPVNTVIYITNLENGKSIRLVVSSALESSGLLALLSRDAADSIGLEEGTMGRIRMGQYTDELAYYGYGADGISLYNPDAIVDLDGYGFPNGESALGPRIDDSGFFVDLPDSVDMLAMPAYTYPDPVQPENEPPLVASQPPVDSSPRTPYIDPSLFIEPIREAPVPPQVVEPVKSDPVPPPIVEPVKNDPMPPLAVAEPVKSEPMPSVIEPVRSEPAPLQNSTGFTITRLPGSATNGSATNGSGFSAPIISSLEKGSYYVQIGAYSIPETVESEIRKIDQQLPVAIMNAGSVEKPVYRVLIGPLNLGESGAILQRYKGTYKDAFVRQGI